MHQMKITVNNKDFLERVNMVGACINSGHHMPILQNLKLENGDGKLTFTATDMEITAKTWMESTVSKYFGVCIPFKMVSGILRSLPNGPVDMDFGAKNLHLVCGHSVYDIPLEDIDAFPKPEELEWKNGFELPTDELSQSIKNALKFNDPMDDLGPFSCIKIYARKGKAKITGFTPQKLYIHELFDTDQEFELLLSSNTANFLSSGVLKDKKVNVSHTDNMIMFQGSDYTITTIKPNKEMPDHEVLIKKNRNNGDLVVMDKKELVSKLNRLVAPSMLTYPIVKFTYGPKDLEMRIHNDFINYKGLETMPCEKIGEPVTIGFNSNHVLNAVGVVTEEALKFIVGKPNQACFLKTNKTEIIIIPYVA